MPAKRSFLLLQGVASPFFSELEKALNKAGYKALKINFCGGDLFSGRFFSTALKHLNFRAKQEELPEFYANIFTQYKITDIILFGDTRPIHTPAIKLAKQKGLNIHVYEEGYFRPNWITLDKGGVNAHSSVSNNPDWYLKTYQKLLKTRSLKSHQTLSTGGGLTIRAWHDIRYHLAKALLKPYFPHYRSHRPDNALKEYWGFIQRMPSVKFYFKHKAKRQINALLANNKPFYLLPLQLDADSQIRLHSPIKNVTELIQLSIQSFAKHAPDDAQLVIKIHPLDPWFVDYPNIIKQAAKQNKVDVNRLIYLEAGDLNLLLEHAQGTVLVNSTVGSSALAKNCPVIALGTAIYDMPGLTFQGSLDDFWNNASPPDKSLFEAFQNVIIEQTQINGSFYNQKGIQMAVSGSLPFFKADAHKLALAEKTDNENKETIADDNNNQFLKNTG